MAQFSQFWTTTLGVGDGADTYGERQLSDWLRDSFTSDRYVSEGVLAGVGNQLAVSGTASPISVGTGSAIVTGLYYQNSSAVSVSVPTPSGGTTGHRVVLRADYGANTVRVALVSSADGTSRAPSVTQDTGETWEISLAVLSVATDGTITITDERDYCRPSPAMIYRRLGGSSSNWYTPGGTIYKPGAIRIQVGVATLRWDDDEDSDEKTITFPQSYGAPPFVFITTLNEGLLRGRRITVSVQSASNSNAVLRGFITDDDDDYDGYHTVLWMAIGPE